MGIKKKRCDICQLEKRHVEFNKFRNLMLCRTCQNRQYTKIPRPGYNNVQLQDALDRVYKVRTYVYKDIKKAYCRLSLPLAFSGKKVKVIIVEDEDGEK